MFHVNLRAHLERGIEQKLFPGGIIAKLEGSYRGSSIIYATAGHHTYDSLVKMNTNDLFDVASITKTITALAAMEVVNEGSLDVEQPVVELIPELYAAQQYDLRVLHLLTFTALFDITLSAHKGKSAQDIWQEILHADLTEPPGGRHFCLNATSIVLGKVLERVLGKPLKNIMDAALYDFVMNRATFSPQEQSERAIVPTERDQWRGRLIRGEVHDETAWKLRDEYGVVGSAGLFCTVLDLDIVGTAAMHTPEWFIDQREQFPELLREGEPVALGWELNQKWMGGSELSWRIGKTGYTGCAMVFDYYAQLGIIILTNRLMPERDEQRLRRFQQWRLETIDALLPK